MFSMNMWINLSGICSLPPIWSCPEREPIPYVRFWLSENPNILIPLGLEASRGDQILNANSFAKQGFSTVLEEEALTGESLLQAINETHKNRRAFIDKMAESHLNNAVSTIIELINECCND